MGRRAKAETWLERCLRMEAELRTDGKAYGRHRTDHFLLDAGRLTVGMIRSGSITAERFDPDFIQRHIANWVIPVNPAILTS